MIQENENQSVVENDENNEINESQENNKKVKSKAEAKADETVEAAAEASTEVEANADSTAETDEGTAEADPQANAKADAVKIEFPYSEIIREKVPKAFEVAEKVATDWKNEGDFTDLGIDHPVAGIVASQALVKAKQVEKKLEEKGVFTMAKMGLEIAKSQVETLKSKINK